MGSNTHTPPPQTHTHIPTTPPLPKGHEWGGGRHRRKGGNGIAVELVYDVFKKKKLNFEKKKEIFTYSKYFSVFFQKFCFAFCTFLYCSSRVNLLLLCKVKVMLNIFIQLNKQPFVEKKKFS